MPESNVVVKIVAVYRNFVKGIRDAEQSLKRFQKNVATTRSFAYKLGGTLEIAGRRFTGWAMSIMWGGFMIQRTFTRILRAGISTFSEVTQSMGWSGSALEQLSAAWTYLKFIVGSALNEALAPLIPTLMNIIQKVADWIQQHPKLFSALTILMALIGALLFYFGALILFIKNGWIPLITWLFSKGFPALGKGIAWLGKLIWSCIGPVLKDIFGEIKSFPKVAKNVIWKVVLAVWKGIVWLFTNPIGLIILAIIIIVTLILNLKRHFKSWKDVAAAVIYAIGWFFIKLREIMVEAALKVLGKILKGIAAFIKLGSKLPWVGHKFREAAQFVKEFGEKLEETDLKWADKFKEWTKQTDFFKGMWKTVEEKGVPKWYELFSPTGAIEGLLGRKLFAPPPTGGEVKNEVNIDKVDVNVNMPIETEEGYKVYEEIKNKFAEDILKEIDAWGGR